MPSCDKKSTLAARTSSPQPRHAAAHDIGTLPHARRNGHRRIPRHILAALSARCATIGETRSQAAIACWPTMSSKLERAARRHDRDCGEPAASTSPRVAGGITSLRAEKAADFCCAPQPLSAATAPMRHFDFGQKTRQARSL